jgi:hypothetical protein
MYLFLVIWPYIWQVSVLTLLIMIRNELHSRS